MFQPWRLKVREAEEALRDGRLEEAGRLLSEPGLLEFLPAKRLMSKVAREMATRAEQQFAAGASLAGWQDLGAAQRLGAEDMAIAGLKQQAIARGLGEADSYMRAGDPAAAVARLESLERQGAGGQEFRLTKEAAGKVLTAQRMCERGQFAQAETELTAALVLRPGWQVLAEIRAACTKRGTQLRVLVENLHTALVAENWTVSLAQAEAILEIAPEHAAALEARRRAWSAVGMQPCPADERMEAAVAQNEAGREPATANMPQREPNPEPAHVPGARFLLWVDGVGGYLVCRGETITLGQPVPGSYVDVPVLGDISRLHATIRRDGESYLINPMRRTQVGGQTIDRTTLLSDRSDIELGDGVRLRMRLPNPLSRTARLDFISRHRTQPTTDGVLLMAESCILGPASTAHIVCRDWSQQVVLFSQGETLFCRAAGKFQVDGVEVEGTAPITLGSQIEGEDFSFSLEKL